MSIYGVATQRSSPQRTVDLQVDCVSAEDAIDAREASECERRGRETRDVSREFPDWPLNQQKPETDFEKVWKNCY